MNTFKKQLSELTDYALTVSGTKNKYEAEDMLNASLVFMEVFSSLMYDYNAGKMDNKQLEQLFEEAGGIFHQTILIFTGIDMKRIFENNGSQKDGEIK